MIDEDCLTLTTYSGERDRAQGHLLADELLDAYGRHRVQASVLLRGAEGFGQLAHRRTDRLLSLSEDLPVVTIAVDRADRIEALLAPVRQLMRRGLITLERTRLMTGAMQPTPGLEAPHEDTKLTVYIGRGERAGRQPAFVAVCDLLHRRGIAGATTLLGVDGTIRGRRRRAGMLTRNAAVPMMVIAVGAGETVAGVLPELGDLLHEPLVTLERVQVCKRDGQLLARPPALPPTDRRGLAMWQKLMVYTSQSARSEGRPLHLEIIRRLRASHAAGATSVQGVWGFHGDHAPHGDRVLQLRRNVPMMTISIDTPQRTADAFAVIDELTGEQGLVTCEMVPALSALSAAETVGGLMPASHAF